MILSVLFDNGENHLQAEKLPPPPKLCDWK